MESSILPLPILWDGDIWDKPTQRLSFASTHYFKTIHMKDTKLFTPIKIRDVEFPNRMFIPPMDMVCIFPGFNCIVCRR